MLKIMNELFKQDQHVYVQVANLLRSQITCDQLKDKIPSIRELSKIYSINFKTANKAVSLLVKEGLVHRVKGKGTFVVDNYVQKTEYPLIGYIVSDIINPNFAYVAQTVQEYAHRKNMSVLVNTTSRKISRLKEILDLYEKNKVEAIIIQGGAIRDKLSQDIMKAVKIPIIGEHTHLPDIDDVWLDVRAGAQMAVTHLLENFGPSIAYISGSDEPVERTGRFQGYRDALLSKRYEIQKDLSWISAKMLSQRLSELKEESILTRDVDSEQIPPSVTYRLTKKGEDMRGVLTMMQTWGMKHGDNATPKCLGQGFSNCDGCRKKD